jgi:hypothetical protein
MKLNDIINFILVEIGEFFLEDVSDAGINKDKLYHLIDSSLSIYEKYRPLTKNFNITVLDPIYTFQEDIPEWISSVVPFGYGGLGDIALVTRTNIFEAAGYIPTSSSIMGVTKPISIFRYNKPKLYVNTQGLMDITGHYKYTRDITRVGSIIKDLDLPEVDHSFDDFFDLLKAKTMIAIGRSRRAFTIQDLPLTTDADQIVNEGNELLLKTMEDLGEKSYWWHAIGT